MDVRNLTLQQLRVLVSVIEAGGFTRAADGLGMSQPGVSHTVAGLETELGLALIQRGRAGVRPTEAGERVLAHARDVLALVERIGHEIDATRQLQTGKLTIAGFPSATSRILPALLGAFHERYPAVEIVLVEGTDQEVSEYLRSGTVDIGFVTLPADELEVVSLAVDAMLALVPEHHPLVGTGAVSIEALAAEPFVMSNGGCEPLISAAFDAQDRSPDTRFEVRDMSTILAMVAEGLGVTIVPELALPGQPGRLAGLRTLSLDPPVWRELGLATRSWHHASPAATAFAELIHSSMA